MAETSLTTRQNPMERMRVRLAAEGYRDLHEKTKDNDDDFNKSTSGGCSRAEKQLSILVIVCFILLVAMAALIGVNYFMQNISNCDTPGCVMTAADIIHNMDLTADPCVDFFQYSCGNYIKNNEIPPDKAQWNEFSEMQKNNDIKIMKLLEAPNDNFRDVTSQAIIKAKQYYKACMNVSEVENKGYAPALYLLRELGGWTMANSVVTGKLVPDQWHLHNALIEAIYHGVHPFFKMVVGPDDQDSDTNVLTFDQGGLTYSNREFYVGNNTEKYHTALVNYITKVGILMTSNDMVARESAENIWEFEKQIAEISVPREERQDQNKLYHKMALDEFDNSIGYGLDLRFVVNSVYDKFHPHLHIRPDIPVINYSPSYFKKLGELLNTTKTETLADYIAWHLLSSVIPYMSTQFRQTEEEFARELLGVASEDPQWKKCVARTSSAVGYAVGAMFVQETYTDEEREKAQQLIEQIRKTFIERLPYVTWMDEQTRSLAQQKAEVIIEKIGYPLKLYESAASLDNYYEMLNVSDDDPFNNMLQARFFALLKNLDKRDNEVDRTEWDMTPETVNAYYNPTNNEIVLPAGILQKPFYSTTYPMAWNFGAIGMVIGHELTHGFDNMGRLFDEKGNLRDWWTNASATGFTQHAQCLKDQYNQYMVEGEHVNGITTLGENIADNGGLHTSFQAYQTWRRDNRLKQDSYRLPGLELTNEQLFFVGFAQIWCEYVNPEQAKSLIITDVHSPAKIRVIGTLSNMEEFAQVYKCDSSSPMNPANKCKVW